MRILPSPVKNLPAGPPTGPPGGGGSGSDRYLYVDVAGYRINASNDNRLLLNVQEAGSNDDGPVITFPAIVDITLRCELTIIGAYFQIESEDVARIVNLGVTVTFSGLILYSSYPTNYQVLIKCTLAAGKWHLFVYQNDAPLF